MWLIVLSDQLPIAALVGRYPTNKLIGRGPIPGRPPPKRKALATDFRPWRHPVLAAVSRGCPGARGRFPRVTHPSATRCRAEALHPVRLACVRRAASVRSEPGSNSQLEPPSHEGTGDLGPRHHCTRPAPGARSPPRHGPLKGDQVRTQPRPRAEPRPWNPAQARRGLRPRHLYQRCLSPRPIWPPPTHPFLLLYLSKDQPGAREQAPAQTQI